MTMAGLNPHSKPLWLLAELTYRCPLQCPYCSNPVEIAKYNDELSTQDWIRVLKEARKMGATQLGLSGGEPLVRQDLEEIIAEGLTIHEVDPGRNHRDMVAEIMEEVGLDPAMMDRYPHEFSGGQRQRISIARAMILRPKLVMLDEPTSALDMSVQAQIVDLLRRLQDEYGLAYLFISHDLSVVRAMSHQVLVMKDGVIVEQAATDQLFDNPQQNYTKALIAAARHLDTAS